MQTTKTQSVSPWLLSLGLVFSVASQLRLPGLPLGLGEALLLLWLLTTLVAAQKWRNPALIGVLALAAVGAPLLSAGYFLTAYPGGQSRPPALHDTVAYFFCAILAINYARLKDKYENSLPAMLLWAFLVSALLALVLGFFSTNWSGMDVMYYHTRWQHLSNNPNQFALLALPLPFLALHLMLRQPAEQNPLIPALLALLALGLGWYSQSNALTLAWIGGGLAAVPALRWGVDSHNMPVSSPTKRFKTQNKLIASSLIVLMVAGSTWQWRSVATEVSVVAETEIETRASVEARVSTGLCSEALDLYQSPSAAGKGQVGVRLVLWCNALAAIQYAPLTGMGPGPHSGFSKPFEGEEAHNTPLDWGTQSGLVGVAALVVYLLWLLWQVVRCRCYELVAMLFALYVFAMFHMVLRQPLFWVIPLLTLQLAQRSSGGDSDAKTCARRP